MIKVLTYVAAALGGLASFEMIPFVSQELGLLIVGLSAASLLVVTKVGDYLDDKKLNDSFKPDSGVSKIMGFLKGLFKKK